MKHAYLMALFSHPQGMGGKFATRMMNVFHQELYQSVLKQLHAQKGLILDIGFGNGYLMKSCVDNLSGVTMYGLEISEDMLNNCGQRFKDDIKKGLLHLQKGSVECMPYETMLFDCVYSLNTIYFWETLQQGLQEIYRVLKQGGICILSFYDPSYLKDMPFIGDQFRTQEKQTVINVMEDLKFNIIQVEIIKKGKAYTIVGQRR